MRDTRYSLGYYDYSLATGSTQSLSYKASIQSEASLKQAAKQDYYYVCRICQLAIRQVWTYSYLTMTLTMRPLLLLKCQTRTVITQVELKQQRKTRKVRNLTSQGVWKTLQKIFNTKISYLMDQADYNKVTCSVILLDRNTTVVINCLVAFL